MWQCLYDGARIPTCSSVGASLGLKRSPYKDIHGLQKTAPIRQGLMTLQHRGIWWQQASHQHQVEVAKGSLRDSAGCLHDAVSLAVSGNKVCGFQFGNPAHLQEE